jgi:hypothetical protein
MKLSRSMMLGASAAAAAIACSSLLVADAAAAHHAAAAPNAACAFSLPDPASPATSCLVFNNLTRLPAAVVKMGENSSFPDQYFVTSPCATIANQSALCPPAPFTGGAPASAAQVYETSCLVLGQPNTSTAAPLASGSSTSRGISLTMTGGDSYSCGGGGRTVRYDLVCDTTVGADNGPDHGVASPVGCDYVVRWRTPLACPATVAGACVGPPLPPAPVPTPQQANYQRHEIMVRARTMDECAAGGVVVVLVVVLVVWW